MENAAPKILAIDDDESILDIYAEGLSAKGYDIKCASTSKQGLDSIAASIPDVILMDIMMPGQDGISLMRDILSKPDTSHVPVLAVSGLADAATLNDALLFGAVDYIVKPFDIDTLDAKIKHAMELAAKRKPK
ncbi:MAG: response regulator [bacterium]